jgi:lauroyl/myristoyl acyltransferase
VVTIEPQGAGIGQQAVITGFHFGPVAALADVLRVSPRRVTALHRMGWAQPPNVDYLAVAHDERGRVAAFHEVLEAVRGGASAFVLADHPEGLSVPLLGGTITMQRGAFALARLTGLPVVALLPRWEGPRVHVRVAPAVAAVPDEHAMAAATALALERYLLEHPHAIGRKLLAELAAQT